MSNGIRGSSCDRQLHSSDKGQTFCIISRARTHPPTPKYIIVLRIVSTWIFLANGMDYTKSSSQIIFVEISTCLYFPCHSPQNLISSAGLSPVEQVYPVNTTPELPAYLPPPLPALFSRNGSGPQCLVQLPLGSPRQRIDPQEPQGEETRRPS